MATMHEIPIVIPIIDKKLRNLLALRNRKVIATDSLINRIKSLYINYLLFVQLLKSSNCQIVHIAVPR